MGEEVGGCCAPADKKNEPEAAKEPQQRAMMNNHIGVPVARPTRGAGQEHRASVTARARSPPLTSKVLRRVNPVEAEERGRCCASKPSFAK